MSVNCIRNCSRKKLGTTYNLKKVKQVYKKDMKTLYPSLKTEETWKVLMHSVLKQFHIF